MQNVEWAKEECKAVGTHGPHSHGKINHGLASIQWISVA